jgi:hypothetical protein
MFIALADDVRNKFLQTWEAVYGKEKTAQILERRSKARGMSEFKHAQEITSIVFNVNDAATIESILHYLTGSHLIPPPSSGILNALQR